MRTLAVLLIAALLVIALILWAVNDENSSLGSPKPTPQITLDGHPKTSLDNVGRWRRELVEGREIIIRRPSTPGQSRRFKSLGPLENTTYLRRTLQEQMEAFRTAMEGFPAEETIKDVVSRTKLQTKMLKRQVCIEKLANGEYITLEEGTPIPPLPLGAQWWRYHGGDVIAGVDAYVLFIIAKGDSQVFDRATEIHKECRDVYLEELVGVFNNQGLAERRARIEAHQRGLDTLNSLRLGRHDLPQKERQKLVREAETAILDYRVKIDKRTYRLSWGGLR